MPTTTEIAEALAAKAEIDALKEQTRFDPDRLDGWVIRSESLTRTGATVVSWWYGLGGIRSIFSTWGPLRHRGESSGVAVYPTRRQAEAAYGWLRARGAGNRGRPQRVVDAWSEHLRGKATR